MTASQCETTYEKVEELYAVENWRVLVALEAKANVESESAQLRKPCSSLTHGIDQILGDCWQLSKARYHDKVIALYQRC